MAFNNKSLDVSSLLVAEMELSFIIGRAKKIIIRSFSKKPNMTVAVKDIWYNLISFIKNIIKGKSHFSNGYR